MSHIIRSRVHPREARFFTNPAGNYHGPGLKYVVYVFIQGIVYTRMDVLKNGYIYGTLWLFDTYFSSFRRHQPISYLRS